LEALKERFDVPDIVRIEPGNGGLTKIVVTTSQAGAEVYLHGAHVTRFDPAGHKPLLWMSRSSWFEPGKPIRGGVPICFPWFGLRQDDPKAPAHGFARLRAWEIETVENRPDGAVIVTLVLKSDDSTRAIWPYDFVARHVIRVSGSIEMTLQVHNPSDASIRLEEALHTYLTVGDIRETTVEGLVGAEFIDKMSNGATARQVDPIIRFTGETDRVYLDTQSTCVVRDPVLRRGVSIEKRGSNSTVVWNHWIAKAKAMPDFGDDEWPRMLCVETANVARHAIELPPGATHAMTARISTWTGHSR
jgi:D-hexose-6-phosphate mutarotase